MRFLKKIMFLAVLLLGGLSYANDEVRIEIESTYLPECNLYPYNVLNYSSSTWSEQPSEADDFAVIPMLFEDPKFPNKGRGTISDMKKMIEIMNNPTMKSSGAATYRKDLSVKLKTLNDRMIEVAHKSAPSLVKTCKQYFIQMAESCSKHSFESKELGPCIDESNKVFSDGANGYVNYSYLTRGKVDYQDFGIEKIVKGNQWSKQFEDHYKKIEKTCINTIYEIADRQSKSTSRYKVTFSPNTNVFKNLFSKENSAYAKSVLQNNREASDHFKRKLKIGFLWENFESFMSTCVSRIDLSKDTDQIYPDKEYIEKIIKENGTLEMSKLNNFFGDKKP